MAHKDSPTKEMWEMVIMSNRTAEDEHQNLHYETM